VYFSLSSLSFATSAAALVSYFCGLDDFYSMVAAAKGAIIGGVASS